MLFCKNASAKLLNFPQTALASLDSNFIFNIYYVINEEITAAVTAFLCIFAAEKILLFGMGKKNISTTKLKRAALRLWNLCKQGAKHVGLPFVYAGVALMGIFYFTGLTNYNLLILLPLLLILLGIVGFVKQEKRKERY